MPRTKQTADLLVKAGLISPDKIIVDTRIIERQAGDLEGKPIISNWDPSFNDKYHAESEEKVKERVLNFYRSILTQYPDGNIIVVTHQLPAKILLEAASNQKVNLSPGEAKVISLPTNK